MSETTATPPAEAAAAEETPAQTESALAEIQVNIRGMLEAGCHFGHQTRRWNPRMKHFIFGERNGIHIVDLDQSLPRFEAGLEFIKETAAAGGKVLFVGTKKQAAPTILTEATRSSQYYVNNRWLGGMLTNWKTVKKSIERYKQMLEILGDEGKSAELSKKELARISRQCEKYEKSLEGMKEMTRLPDALFVIDVGRETIAITEARRLGIPIVAIVDTNCSPEGIDFVIPGNDDSMRAINLYCAAVANACIEGAAMHQDRLVSDAGDGAGGQQGGGKGGSGRRVVEIKQAPRRGRGQGQSVSGRAHSAGGEGEDAAAAEAGAAPEAAKAPAAAAPEAPKTPAAAAPEAPKAAAAPAAEAPAAPAEDKPAGDS